MQTQDQLQRPHVLKLRAAGRRAYMNQQPAELPPTNEKQTQTELGLTLAGMKHFVTPRLVLSAEEAADTAFAASFARLCQLVRSAEWRPSLLVVLGHDPEKRRDELERKIREDEASEAIDFELRVFFDSVLAPMIQQRETALVNSIHDCVQLEMHSQQQVIRNQQQRMTQLTQQIEEREKQVAHLKGKVDRRVAENNALRKEQYRQLLMLRDIMSRQGADPGALSALNEAIATVLTGKQQTPVPETTQSNEQKNPGRGWTPNSNTQTLHREKEKWEQRAREAASECQELRDKLAQLTQENVAYRANEAGHWFLKPESAIAERQRIADAVSSYQGSWEDIGDSLVELLNNEILWAAVEKSARRGGKHRVSRGLEAVLTQLDNLQYPTIEESPPDKEDLATPLIIRKRSTLAEMGRLIPCSACNGVGYIHADEDENANDEDSYLRKTLEQVLELKTQLEKANTKTLKLEGQLQISQEKVLQAELIKSTAVDSGLQTDLDEEEGLDLDEITRSAYGRDSPANSRLGSRQNRRNKQYEHLIVELKNALADKEEGLTESREALAVAQTRAVSLQRALQKEKDIHAQELGKLKISLAFSLKSRNSKIEERQAAVKLLMKKFGDKPQKQSVKQASMTLLPTDEAEDDIDEETTDTNEQVNDQSEVKRMEALVQRYAEDIVRVRKEHETQQELLKKAETDITEEETKRSRTNSISQGNLVVTLASHPRDLFKALSTAQADMLNLRRASQRSSALQTDRLLTLTRHLGHMSEELCTLRKRNLAELEFWKLECEKLQNTNKALEAEQEIVKKQLQEARSQKEVEDVAGTCSLCEKHKKRLMQISTELLNQTRVSNENPESEVPSASALTESERKMVSSALLDLETLCSGMTATKQQLAREMVATHLGNELNPRSSRRTTIDLVRSPIKAGRTNLQGKEGLPVSPRSAGSPRKSPSPVKSSKSSRQLNKVEVQSTSRGTMTDPVSTDENEQNSAITGHQERVFDSFHRKTLVQKIMEDRGHSLPENGPTSDNSVAEGPELETSVDKHSLEADNNADLISIHDEPQDVPVADKADLSLKLEETLLIHGSTTIQHDPEVIRQLRHLVNASATATERLAARKWNILVCRLLLLADEHRLEQLKFFADKRARFRPDGSLRPVCLKIISTCDAMIKIVQQRRNAESTAVVAHEVSYREFKKAQTLLIQGVAMLLDNLSRNGKPKLDLNELLYLRTGGSPRRSPTSNRPVYPSAKIHLSHLPQTQQIPTSTFPALVRPHSNERVRPNSSRNSGERPAEASHDRQHRLIKSAGPRPFNVVHSSIGALQGSIPIPDPVCIRSVHETEGKAMSLAPQRPVRPHSSPAGARFMSPRAQEVISSTSSLHRPEKIIESE